MTQFDFLAIALDLDPISIASILLAGFVFIIMFAIISIKTDAKGIFDWMIEHPADKKN